MLKAIKVRIYPTPEQADFLHQQFGAVRLVYNKGLHLIRHYYRRYGKSLNAKRDIKSLLPIAKRSRKYHWLKGYDSVALQQACLNLHQAFLNFFDPKLKAGYPNFKNRHGKQSSYHCMGIKLSETWIKLPKMGEIKARVHRKLIGKLKSITVSRSCSGKYYAAILIDDESEPPKLIQSLDESKIIGLDMGLCDFISDSNGKKEANPKFLRRATRNLQRKQRQLSRKQKGSNKRSKARILLAKCHERLKQVRHDFQHKLSKRIVDESQAIMVESLKIKNMLKNKRLAKHISDASWESFLKKLAYKAEAQGKYFICIDQWFASSKTCSNCHHKVDEMPLSIRQWQCPSCSVSHDRDINAAKNIKQQGVLKLKAEGLSVSANRGLCKSGVMPAVA